MDFENIEEELKKFLEGMRSLGNLKKVVEEGQCGMSKCCRQEQEEELDEEDEEILESLEEDYKAFMEWAFDTEKSVQTSKKRAMKVWQKLHPGLPIPRVIQMDRGLNPSMSTVCLFMDAYPLYLAEKKKCNG